MTRIMAVLVFLLFVAPAAHAGGINQPDNMICVSGTTLGTDQGRDVEVFDVAPSGGNQALACAVCLCYSYGLSNADTYNTWTPIVLWGVSNCPNLGPSFRTYCQTLASGSARYVPDIGTQTTKP